LAQPKYDAAGNLTQIPKPDDPTQPLTCKYDAWNRLVEVTEGKTPVASYQYDALHRRIVKQSGSTWRHYYYYSADNQVIEEREASSATEQPEFPDWQHFWGVRPGELMLSVRGAVTSNRSTSVERICPIRDANGNVTALASRYEADEKWTVSRRFGYQPYGQPIVRDKYFDDRNDRPSDGEFLFAGYRYDWHTVTVRRGAFLTGLVSWGYLRLTPGRCSDGEECGREAFAAEW